MNDVQRELAARLVRALILRGGGYSLTAVGDLVPTLETFSLEHSAWPPHRAWKVTALASPIVGEVSIVAVGCHPQASATARVIVDEALITSGETSGALRTGRGLVSGLPSPFEWAKGIALDIAEDPNPGFIQPLIHEVQSYTDSDPAGPIISSAAAMPYGTASIITLRPRYPLAILSLGQVYIIQTVAVNVALSVEFRGRFFP